MAEEAGDADTADVFTGMSRQPDKQLWFVEAHWDQAAKPCPPICAGDRWAAG